MKSPSFSRIVSSAEPVVGAFDCCGPTRFWWRAILWLHGKPTSPIIDGEERRHIVAEGFRFYAQLYRFLGVLFWLTGAACWSAGIFETGRDAFYWTGASGLVGAFLWFASSLGFAGTKALKQRHGNARLVLCAFMVSIIAFLSALTAVLSVVVQLLTSTDATLNLCALSLVWAIGIASCLIEVLYLVGGTQCAIAE